MKQKFIKKESNSHLILFFAGWGSDENLFNRECNSECDYMLCYDYKNLDFNTAEISHYKKITIIGWSMGVWTGQKVLSKYIRISEGIKTLSFGNSEIQIVNSIAINGSPWPISNTKGIPVDIFRGTLDNFSESTLVRFRRRICGTSENSKEFISHKPYRGIEDLRSELNALWNMIDKENQENDSASCSNKTEQGCQKLWTKAIVGKNDKIFPKNNQIAAWTEYGIEEKYIETTDSEHYDSNIINSILYNPF